jgi:5-methylcytosine-specific restriction protein A
MPMRPPIHSRQHVGITHDAYEETRLSPSKRGYDRTEQKVARLYLDAHPLCVQCLLEGRIEPATDVDHIEPISRGGARLDESNLQSLCHAHHSAKTATEQHGHAQPDLP